MNEMTEMKCSNSLIFMSVMRVLEFERAAAIVTFDIPISNGDPIHITFTSELMKC